MANRCGKVETVTDFLFLGSKTTYRWWLQPWNLKTFAPWKESYAKPRQHVKKQRHHFGDKDLYGQRYCFSSSHVWIWELDHKEGRVVKNWCFWTVLLEKTLESPLDCKEIKPIYPKGDQPWIFNGMTDAEVEAPILWSPDVKSHLTGKDPDTGNDWGQEEKGAAEDEMLRLHHWLNWHEFEQTLGNSGGQRSLTY